MFGRTRHQKQTDYREHNTHDPIGLCWQQDCYRLGSMGYAEIEVRDVFKGSGKKPEPLRIKFTSSAEWIEPWHQLAAVCDDP